MKLKSAALSAAMLVFLPLAASAKPAAPRPHTPPAQHDHAPRPHTPHH